MIDPEMMLFLMEKAEGARIEVHGPWILFSDERRDPEQLTDEDGPRNGVGDLGVSADEGNVAFSAGRLELGEQAPDIRRGRQQLHHGLQPGGERQSGPAADHQRSGVGSADRSCGGV